ncbi:MAG: GTPase Era [Candidatus Latescibacterota bacterium]|nr:MAG: GTPase Era [Candidatus Latescibacterota bacterium]
MDTKCGYVAIVGRPNVGKSTLMNSLIGEKLSIVTPKPQTTRTRVLGVLTEDGVQMIFLDTPGFLQPRGLLQEAMVKEVKEGLSEADVVLGIVDATALERTFDEELQGLLKASGRPVVIALNKMDLVAQKEIFEGLQWLYDRFPAELVPISALKGHNLDELKKVLAGFLPEGPFLYPPEVLADQPERFFVAELIREELFLNLGQELPYATAVKVEEFKERDPSEGKTYIRATIYVEKPSQRGIVIGEGGAMLKKIGQWARRKIEAFLGRPVYLELWVKVRPKWSRKEGTLRELGYLR